METEIKKVPVTVLVDPSIKQRLGLAAVLSGLKFLTVEAEARLVKSLDADGIYMPKEKDGAK